MLNHFASVQFIFYLVNVIWIDTNIVSRSALVLLNQIHWFGSILFPISLWFSMIHIETGKQISLTWPLNHKMKAVGGNKHSAYEAQFQMKYSFDILKMVKSGRNHSFILFWLKYRPYEEVFINKLWIFELV